MSQLKQTWVFLHLFILNKMRFPHKTSLEKRTMLTWHWISSTPLSSEGLHSCVARRIVRCTITKVVCGTAIYLYGKMTCSWFTPCPVFIGQTNVSKENDQLYCKHVTLLIDRVDPKAWMKPQGTAVVLSCAHVTLKAYSESSIVLQFAMPFSQN